MPGRPAMKPQIALIGDPVAHSLSPQIQAAAFQAVGLDWGYQLLRVPRGQLTARWSALRSDFVGLNVTIPLKEDAARLVTRTTAAAGICGSVNTVMFQPGAAIGDSTDGPGFMAALARGGVEQLERAAVIGTGGAARAVVAALAARGTAVMVLGRHPEAGRRIADDLSGMVPGQVGYGRLCASDLASALVGADLLVNATPLGGPTAPDRSPLPEAMRLPAGLAVVDLVYRPRRTPLLQQAAASGCRVVEGIEMLVEQAALSFAAWTGTKAPVEVMRRAAYLGLQQSLERSR